ncbi:MULTISPECIES: MarR family winged helix-turn-helix transcriptional regulator [unclassified Aeromicrobium]|uniref:MarR family winged helix-turn-helix transcriptional regulator n=1 Tax=unclassified Aeromicrobium TaxID=2633570 RepID=UPI0006F9A675|nr:MULTISPECIES: MarR family transcriptional regulator [unclassified Aeromicrobium]KQO39870.1 MarR family transcriptional regulator [Aeromicrobium sp. Leaf245]KQP78969.1 MarR family transcriptional regulator [Aeromicrobium sp. Leaf289]KQP84678.1 MarR family transcriptional regulator [Aeromicrobium sp. Leaf291]RYY50939.1 MAG: MarR family transcriptional regulator [Actinomycetales bacterium]
MTTAPTDTPWLDADQQQWWRSYMGGTTVLIDQLDRDLRAAHDLSMAEYEILVRLSEADDRSIRMAELAAAVSHSRSRITHTIARLERDGIVRRTASCTDGRGVSAVLTDHGYEVLGQAAHTHVRGVHEYLVSRCSREDLEAVGRVFEAVRDGLEGRRF